VTRLLRGRAFIAVAIAFMAVGLSRSGSGAGGASAWIALGVVFLVLGAVRLRRERGGDE
jgi:hypothetical protein